MDYNNYLRASQIENIMNYLEKKEIDMDCLKKEYIKNRPISKHNKDLKVKGIMFLINKLTRLL